MARSKKQPVSIGIRKRLGRSVKDATEPIYMPLTQGDVTAAMGKRGHYDLDDPENFSECVLATCIQKVAGAQVHIYRKHAYVALPGDRYTLRYEIAPETTVLVHLNDEGRFKEMPKNATIKLHPPCKSRQLASQRNSWKQQPRPKTGRGPSTPHGDPYKGVWRNGVHATDA